MIQDAWLGAGASRCTCRGGRPGRLAARRRRRGAGRAALWPRPGVALQLPRLTGAVKGHSPGRLGRGDGAVGRLRLERDTRERARLSNFQPGNYGPQRLIAARRELSCRAEVTRDVRRITVDGQATFLTLGLRFSGRYYAAHAR